MSLSDKINNLQEQIEGYSAIPDANKLGKGNEINKLINECENILNGYEETLNQVSNIEVYDNEEDYNLTQEEFIELINEINTAHQTIKSTTDLDIMLATIAEMSINVNKCEGYRANKQMTVTTL